MEVQKAGFNYVEKMPETPDVWYYRSTGKAAFNSKDEYTIDYIIWLEQVVVSTVEYIRAIQENKHGNTEN